MTVKIAYTYGQWAEIQERLAQLGIHPDPKGKAICSYKYNTIPLDIMASDDGHMGPANSWYKVGFNNIQRVALDDVVVQILTAPCFIATKFDAFNDRGGGDHRSSHDFEDIIYVLDNRLDIVKEIETDDPAIRNFIIEELTKVVNHPAAQEILSCHVHPFVQDVRLPLLKEKINQIIT